MAFDPAALAALGWRGGHTHGSSEVAAARAELQARNGIRDLASESVSPADPGFAERAAALFHRNGFCLVTDVLTQSEIATIRAGCARVVTTMATADQRLSHRWSFGTQRRPWGLVEREWAVLIDPEPLRAVLTAIYGTDDYLCAGCGGDFCLPGAVEYQGLHSDIGAGLDSKLELDEGDTGTLQPGGSWEPDPGSGMGRRVPLGEPHAPGKRYVHGAAGPLAAFHDPSGRLDIRDLPPTFLAVNFPLELGEDASVGHSHVNGPTRQIPGTQNSKLPLPTLEEEPDWMRKSGGLL